MAYLLIKEIPDTDIKKFGVSQKRLIEMSAIATIIFKSESRRMSGMWHLTQKGKLLISGMSNRLVAIPVTSFLDKKFIRFHLVGGFHQIKRDFKFRVEMVGGPDYHIEVPIIDYHYETKCTPTTTCSE